MDGLFTAGYERFKSKKAVKEAVARGETVRIEYTSIFGGPEFKPQTLQDLPVGRSVTFVGPDPYRARNFYGTAKMTAAGLKVS